MQVSSETAIQENVKSLAVQAVLICDIVYFKGSKEIKVKLGTSILIDLNNLIALVGEDHTSLDRHEFSVVS